MKAARGIILKPATAERVLEATRRVLEPKTRTPVKPYGTGYDGRLWLKVVETAGDIGGLAVQWTYTCELHTSPFPTGDPLATVLALNAIEIGNTAELASGYNIVELEEAECGDVINIEPIRAGTWLESQGVYESNAAGDPAIYHVFTYQNIPVVKGTE